MNCSFKKFLRGVPGIIGGDGNSIGGGRNGIDVDDEDDDISHDDDDDDDEGKNTTESRSVPKMILFIIIITAVQERNIVMYCT